MSTSQSSQISSSSEPIQLLIAQLFQNRQESLENAKNLKEVKKKLTELQVEMVNNFDSLVSVASVLTLRSFQREIKDLLANVVSNTPRVGDLRAIETAGTSSNEVPKIPQVKDKDDKDSTSPYGLRPPNKLRAKASILINRKIFASVNNSGGGGESTSNSNSKFLVPITSPSSHVIIPAVIVCSDCKKTFKKGSGKYSAHLKGLNACRPHACPDCGKRFKKRYSVTKHQISHKDVKLKCSHAGCDNVYKSKDSLRRHMLKHKQSNLQVETDAIDFPATDEQMRHQEGDKVPAEDKNVYLCALSLQPHQPKSLIKVESPSSM